MPVLIALLNDLPLDQVWEVEDLLIHLAGDKAPSERAGSDAASRAASVAAWTTWWGKQENTVDLSRLATASRDRGLLLVIEQQGPKGQGRVLELSPAGKVRWQVEGLMWPWDAQVCPNGHIFVVEQQNRVSERDRQGKIIWQKICNNPFSCHACATATSSFWAAINSSSLTRPARKCSASNSPATSSAVASSPMGKWPSSPIRGSTFASTRPASK